jgi:hypothetical protein
MVELIRDLIFCPGRESLGVVGVDGVGEDRDSEVDLELVRSHVVFELLPLLFDVEVPADVAEGTGQPPE